MKASLLLCLILSLSLSSRASAETIVVESTGLFCNFVRWTCVYSKVIVIESNDSTGLAAATPGTTSDPTVDIQKAK